MKSQLRALFKTSLLLMILTIMGSFSGMAWGQSVTPVGKPHKDWRVFTYKNKGKLICFIYSGPSGRASSDQKRGPVGLRVTHRPAEKVFDEMSYESGYSLKPKSNVEAKIGKTTYSLFTTGQTSWAWTVSAEEDKKIVKSMRSGSVLTVKGESELGKKINDKFSLAGFTSAHKAMNATCKR